MPTDLVLYLARNLMLFTQQDVKVCMGTGINRVLNLLLIVGNELKTGGLP